MDFLFLISLSVSVLCFGYCNSDGIPDSEMKSDDVKKYTGQLSVCKLEKDFTKKLVPGPKGQKGEKGEKGEKGINGIPGRIGPSGYSGKSGKCREPCPYKSKDESDLSKFGEGPKLGEIGSQTNPFSTPCYVKNGEKFDDRKIWVNPNGKFEVQCEKDTGRTCLIINPGPTQDYIDKNAINYKTSRLFWFSEMKYSLEQFYAVNSMDQIGWLQKNATKVSQKIRYHCKNSFVSEEPESALRMFGWSDMLIGHRDSGVSPLAYSVSNHGCTTDAPKDEWRFTDIAVESKNPKNLPVIDFQIRDVRQENQNVFLELRELCFEYI